MGKDLYITFRANDFVQFGCYNYIDIAHIVIDTLTLIASKNEAVHAISEGLSELYDEHGSTLAPEAEHEAQKKELARRLADVALRKLKESAQRADTMRKNQAKRWSKDIEI